MENVLGLKGPARKRRKPVQSKAIANTACRCGITIPSTAQWYEFIFEDRARLSVSVKQFWTAGNCPVAALNRLVCDFSLTLEDGAICAPFAFSPSDDPERICRFLHAIMRLLISDYDCRSGYNGGNC
jgi:hypothetical protein